MGYMNAHAIKRMFCELRVNRRHTKSNVQAVAKSRGDQMIV